MIPATAGDLVSSTQSLRSVFLLAARCSETAGRQQSWLKYAKVRSCVLLVGFPSCLLKLRVHVQQECVITPHSRSAANTPDGYSKRQQTRSRIASSTPYRHSIPDA